MGGNAPLTETEADSLFEPLGAFDTLVLAVSGGADSTALMYLVHGWSRRLGRDAGGIVAVTIDHGLRPASAAEAAAVGRQAEALGIGHRILAWTGLKPTTGLQAAARRARFALLAGVASEMAGTSGGRVAIVTAHTADDQAETVLMRLARGSGVDGLAGIPFEGFAATSDGAGESARYPVLRPLLSVPHARLVATLATAGIAFADDPSNRDRRFERVRVREALRGLKELGVTREALLRTAARMQAARRALDRAADDLEARAVTVVLGIVREIDRDALAVAPSETAVRVLRRVLAIAGGKAPPAELGAVEDAVGRLAADPCGPVAFTLGGCVVEAMPRAAARRALIRVYREPDRDGGLPRISLEPGERVLWDRRFRAEVSNEHQEAVEVGPLGSDWAALSAAHPVLARLPVPAAAARGIPAFRSGGGIIAVPLLAEFALGAGDEAAAAALAGPLRAGATGARRFGEALLRTTPSAGVG
jgi:tRNA(Ile)-lysidine synthase